MRQEDLVSLLGEASPLPVTYAGGARSIEDLARVTELGKGKVRRVGSNHVMILCWGGNGWSGCWVGRPGLLLFTRVL